MLSNLSLLHLIVSFSIPCHLIGYTSSHQGANAEDILCRMCGEEISNIKYTHNHLSPDSILVKNQTDFEKNGIFVQVLANPVGMKFNLMTLYKSTCSGHGSWHADHSWFPGFAWKICLCPRCHKHLGCGKPLIHSVELSSTSNMGGSTELTERQAAFLASCEEEFKNRFQQGDTLYDNECKNVLVPPIRTPWYKPHQRRRRNFNNHRDFRRRSRSRSRSRGRDERRDVHNRGWDRGRHRRDERRDYERRGYRDDERRQRYNDDRSRPYDYRSTRDDRREHRDPGRDGESSYNDERAGYYERRERD